MLPACGMTAPEAPSRCCQQICPQQRYAGHVEQAEVPGLVALVARGDDVHVTAVGHKAFGDSEPIGRDAIFRIASITKPIVGAAAMRLVEDGAIALQDPVGWLPELAEPRVLRRLDSELDDTVPADRPITVEDVLSFRFGFGSIMDPGPYPIQQPRVSSASRRSARPGRRPISLPMSGSPGWEACRCWISPARAGAITPVPRWPAC
jgi:CubicO group peptidase (beta-lactamase class C family)